MTTLREIHNKLFAFYLNASFLYENICITNTIFIYIYIEKRRNKKKNLLIPRLEK